MADEKEQDPVNYIADPDEMAKQAAIENENLIPDFGSEVLILTTETEDDTEEAEEVSE